MSRKILWVRKKCGEEIRKEISRKKLKKVLAFYILLLYNNSCVVIDADKDLHR